MILVTLGTQKQPFNRLLEAIEKSNIKDKIIVQIGPNQFTSNKMTFVDYVPYEEMSKLEDESDFIITHGGTGSIIGPLKKGKKIIGCARLSKYGEHVDDHQTELIHNFAHLGYILEFKEDDDLNDVVKQIKTFKPIKFKSNQQQFINDLKKVLDGGEK